MHKDEHISYWLKIAKEDFETMNYLLEGGRYMHALFFGHLYLKKYVKQYGYMIYCCASPFHGLLFDETY